MPRMGEITEHKSKQPVLVFRVTLYAIRVGGSQIPPPYRIWWAPHAPSSSACNNLFENYKKKNNPIWWSSPSYWMHDDHQPIKGEIIRKANIPFSAWTFVRVDATTLSTSNQIFCEIDTITIKEILLWSLLELNEIFYKLYNLFLTYLIKFHDNFFKIFYTYN